jgi:hypothetical protein
VGSLLSLLSGILTFVNWILGRVEEDHLIQQGRDQVTQETLQKDRDDAVTAAHIDADVRTADLAALQQRMSKYRRPGS